MLFLYVSEVKCGLWCERIPKMKGQNYQGNETKMDEQVEEKRETCCIFKYMDFLFMSG